MDCGIPFCHQGCPLGNLIPEWNDLVRRGEWRLALERLHATNNFPEFTGLICPAPCEAACVLAINDDPVMIKAHRVGDHRARVPRGLGRSRSRRSARLAWSRRRRRLAGRRGSPPAEELNALGHRVVVYERDEGPGGLIRLGVPDFKLENRRCPLAHLRPHRRAVAGVPRRARRERARAEPRARRAGAGT